jgi:hypothetical protein
MLVASLIRPEDLARLNDKQIDQLTEMIATQVFSSPEIRKQLQQSSEKYVAKVRKAPSK